MIAENRSGLLQADSQNPLQQLYVSPGGSGQQHHHAEIAIVLHNLDHFYRIVSHVKP